MPRRAAVKVFIIAFVLIALAAVAPGYASRGGGEASGETAAHTGEILVGLRIADVLDKGADPQHLPGDNEEGKDIAATEALCLADPLFFVGESGYYRSVSAIVAGAYPYYETG